MGFGGYRNPTAATVAVLLSIAAKAIGNDKKEGLCVIGSTPLVDPSKPNHGIKKYQKLVEEMASNCKVMAHLGNTKPGTIHG